MPSIKDKIQISVSLIIASMVLLIKFIVKKRKEKKYEYVAK